MRSLQVEDDAHRVLQLVRAQQTLAKARAKTSHGKSSNATNKLSGAAGRRPDSTASPERHRHTHTVAKQPATTLIQAKTQALMAVYGLRTAEPTKQDAEGKHGSPTKGSQTEATRQELLATRRRIYRNHFSGLQATYGPSGRPKLETLIDAAVEAKRSCCKHSSLAIGAAVLTSANRIYTSGRLESAQDTKFDVCAERAALLKVLEHQQQSSSLQQVEVVEAMVVCSDQRGLLPMPCGSCREFLAEFGDFPVFLLNAENDSRETRSFELFPHARHSTFTAMAVRSAAQDQPRDTKAKPTSKAAKNRPMDVRDWSCEEVSAWIKDVVELPQYADVVLDKRVDGATLWHLQDSDLQLLLGIVQPLHRRRLLLHIDRLKDRELLEHGIDFAQLEDYLAVLDRDRMEVVAQLKATFDRLDQNKDGFLDFAELKSALRELDLDVNTDGASSSSAIATDQLLQSLASASGSDKVSFPVFVKAFSQLAQLPAAEVRDAFAGNANGVPSGVDLVSLRATFDRADTNKSGSIDEQELIGLLQSLGRDNCQARAKEWFQAVDGDGDGRLSFAEFFLRYAQLTKLDLKALRTAFDAEGKGQWRSIQALERALHRLFPLVATADIKTWCQRRPWLDETDTESEKANEKKTLTFAEFVLACVMYGNALQLRVAQLRKMQQTLQNDALCHRSRIVHLQQSGHVRLCRHPGGDAAEDQEEQRSLGERRRAATSRRSRNNREELKDGEDDDEEEHDDDEHAVERVFRRFAVGKKKIEHKRRRQDDDEDDGKQPSDEEEEEEQRLNSVEAAQALMELGIVCSRDQLQRYLDREGFGLRRSLTKREFGRIFKRLKVFQAMPRGVTTAEKEKRQRELWNAIGRAASGRMGEKAGEISAGRTGQKHVNRRDYDEYLRSKHKQQQGRRRDDDDDDGKEGSEEEDVKPRRDRKHSVELRRSQSQRRRSTSSSCSSSSSSSSDRRRGRSRRRRASRSRSRRRRDGSSTSTASSTDSSHQSPRQNTRRSRSQTRGEPFFRGFEVGDRVSSRSQGSGTLVRLYRDYFVADVHFDSGDRAKNVELSHLRRVTETEDKSQRANDKLKRKALVVGACVRVAHKGTKAAFRKGTILRCRTDGTYDVVANEHGEQELLQRVPFGQIVLAGKPVVYSEGQCVTVKRKHEYLRGCVELCRTNGTYDVRVKSQGSTRVLKELAWELLAPDETTGGDDGEEEDDDDGSSTTKKEEESARRWREKQRQEEDEDEGKNADDEDGDDAFEPEFSKGDRVEARFQGQAAYYGGRITRVHSDGACDVAYDDGDAETRVPSRFIRAVSASKSKPVAKSKPSPRDAYEDDFDSD